MFYAADSTLPITITADASQKTLAVKDHGTGIPKDKLETIFDSFVTSGKNQGTGLGLSFCKRGMEDMGGGRSIAIPSLVNTRNSYCNLPWEDPIVLYSELYTLIEDVISHFKAAGRDLPPIKVRPMSEVV